MSMTTMRDARAAGIKAIVATSLAFGLCNCAVTTHEARMSPLGTPRGSAAMEAHLDEPGTVELETIAVADWSVPYSGLVNFDDPKVQAAGFVDHDEPIQIFLHVIRHPKRGLFLVDTGVEKALHEDPGTSAFGPLVRMKMDLSKMTIHVDTRDWIAAQRRPINGVFFTHLHVDHIAGLADVPRMVPLYTGAGEAGDTKFLNLFVFRSTDKALEGCGPLLEWPAQKDPDGRFETVTDVFGDEMVWALGTPGHTAGSTAYVVRTPKGPVLLTGDASHTRWGWDNGVVPGTFSTDIEGSKKSLANLKALAARHPKMEVRLGHQR
jgi:glyoxylase-like metal-dependent hydrolase (beta-lactamase superfamily II)